MQSHGCRQHLSTNIFSPSTADSKNPPNLLRDEMIPSQYHPPTSTGVPWLEAQRANNKFKASKFLNKVHIAFVLYQHVSNQPCVLQSTAQLQPIPRQCHGSNMASCKLPAILWSRHPLKHRRSHPYIPRNFTSSFQGEQARHGSIAAQDWCRMEWRPRADSSAEQCRFWQRMLQGPSFRW